MPLSVRSLVFISLATSLHAAPEWKNAQPILSESCYDCHNAKKTKGGVDLERLDKDPKVEPEYTLWEKVQEVVAKGEMPPKDEAVLSQGEKDALLGWVGHELNLVATRNAGDPGPVTLRRLTNAEYDYTIRDLTGIDYGIAKEFQPDGGGGEGFANTGDTLFVNPSQLDKYLSAARKLVDYATVMPGTGITFQPQRVGPRGYDQVKGQAQQALYVWYQKMSGPHLPKDGEDLREAEYLLACWKWKFHEQTGATSLEQLAKDAKLSAPFLSNWWWMLHNVKYESRYLDLTRTPWLNLPGPDAAKPKEVPAIVMSTVQAIQAQRRSWNNPKRPGSGIQRQQQDADGIRSYPAMNVEVKGQKEFHVILGDIGDGNAGDYVQITSLNFRRNGKTYEYTSEMRRIRDEQKKLLTELDKGNPLPPGLSVNGVKKQIGGIDNALALFGKDPLGQNGVPANALGAKAPAVITLPLPDGVYNVFGAGKLDMRNPEIDQATVQWTLAVGTPPNPSEILPGVLTVWKRQTEAARKTMSDFGRMKAVFPDMYERLLEEVAGNLYRRTPGPGVYYYSDEQLTALLGPAQKEELRQMREDWAYVAPSKLPKDQVANYDKLMRGHLHHFADLAWRRPTTEAERTDLSKLYEAGIAKELDRESAAREVMVRILVSPHFLFKTELNPPVVAAASPELPKSPTQAVSAWELASRLSYFLWSSLPDGQLRKVAADGSLLKPEVRAQQVKRMMKDPRANAFAKQFMGQWLEFDGFQKGATVDAKKFPEFTPELQRDLYAETVAFFDHLIREDRPVMEILTADYTYLNERLAKHYGVPNVKGDDLQKVSVTAQHRGGLLGQGSLLTKTSRSHRTSPVLRGNWLLQSVLGTPVPPPPADVPELKEHGEKPATVREMLTQHRAAKACSSCHDRIDPLGFALEGFDAIGRFRDKDESGLPLDTSGQVKDVKFIGFEGLRDFLKSHKTQFEGHFTRKLVGYALGRQVLPTDKLLIEDMKNRLKKPDAQLSTAVLAVVESSQFLNRRTE